jgi:C_GCAxxG_C_C family probable redox protein
MNRKEKAMALFESGYNCAQSVVLAFSDLTDADEKMLARLSSSFGGGMGRLREVCGAVSGAFMVLGLLYGYDGAETGAKKAEHYMMIQHFAERFSNETGSIVCRELLGLDKKKDSPIPDKRTAEYYKKRPCKELVGLSAEILEEMIEEK